MMVVRYGIHSRDYLKRARKQLDIGSDEALFYAAFELRCGIEARMQEYLEAEKRLKNKVKAGWRIAVLGQKLKAAFPVVDKVAEFAIFDRDGRHRLTHSGHKSPPGCGQQTRRADACPPYRTE